jgi:hypothetical protein
LIVEEAQGAVMVDSMRKQNEKAATDPEPGDYWHEMFTGTCLVVDRRGDAVCVCWDKLESGPFSYQFVNPTWTTIKAFKRRLSYDNIPGYWCDLGQRGRDVTTYADLIPPVPDFEAIELQEASSCFFLISSIYCE